MLFLLRGLNASEDISWCEVYLCIFVCDVIWVDLSITDRISCANKTSISQKRLPIQKRCRLHCRDGNASNKKNIQRGGSLVQRNPILLSSVHILIYFFPYIFGFKQVWLMCQYQHWLSWGLVKGCDVTFINICSSLHLISFQNRQLSIDELFMWW